jgi:hypothetical protein
LDPNQINNFLQKIGYIESNNGKNINHPVISFGVNKGERAIGTYGLTPNTVDDMLSRMRSEGSITPELSDLQNLDHNEMRQVLEQRPDLQKQIAERLAQHVLTRQGGNQEAAAYSWNAGHNLPPQRITPDKLDNSSYVQKFRGLQNVVPLKSTAANSQQIDLDSPNIIPADLQQIDLDSPNIIPADLQPVNQQLNKGGPVKATAELDASKDPMGYIKSHRNMSIKGLRGVAFDDGGTVPDSDSSPSWEDQVHSIMNTVKTTGQLPPDLSDTTTAMGTMGLSTEDAGARALLFNKLQQAGYELKPKNLDTHLPTVDVYHNGKAISTIPFDSYEGTLHPLNTYIPPEHQGQGLATAAYQKIEQATGKNIVPSEDQTDAARALWSERGNGKYFGKPQ